MKFSILTTLPQMFESFLTTSIMARAIKQGLIRIDVIDIRNYSLSKHKNTDDYPYGGGAGMLMMPQPAADAIKAARGDNESIPVYYMSPKGDLFTQKMAISMACEKEIILLCGHYEGLDQRVIDKYVTREISVGDYILTGGELPAMMVTDCVSRLIPGVLGSDESTIDESFSDSLLEYPQYTRPRVFEGMNVPDVLLSGNHAQIRAWKKEQSLLITREKRPDLLKTKKAEEEERCGDT